MHKAGTITIRIDTPQDFIEACEKYGLNPESVVQCFVDYLSMYSMVSPRIDHASTRAADIVGNFVNQRGTVHGRTKNRKVNIEFVKQLIQLMEDESDIEKSLADYSDLISRWYKKLK